MDVGAKRAPSVLILGLNAALQKTITVPELKKVCPLPKHPSGSPSTRDESTNAPVMAASALIAQGGDYGYVCREAHTYAENLLAQQGYSVRYDFRRVLGSASRYNK